MSDIDEIRRANLRALEAELGGTTKAAEAVGMSPAQFINLRDGAKDSKTGKPRGMRKETARRFELAAGKPEGWLDQDHTASPAPSPTPIDLGNNPEYPAVRRVRFKLSAGVSGFAVEYLDGEDAPIVFRKDWFESNGYRPDKLFATKVANGSMEPGLYNGDIVIVNTDQTRLKDGVVFAVNYEGELVIKRLVRDDGQWWLYSDNPDQKRYPRKLCHESVFLIGEIVYKQSAHI